MAAHKPVELTNKQIEGAETIWVGFTKLMKFSIIACIIVLAVLGLIFIDW